MAVVLKGPWTRQPQYRVGGNQENSIGHGLRALFDMRTGTDLVTGNKASANTGTAQVTRGNICRDFSGTANVQFASHPNYAITGPITILGFLDIDALSNFGAFIAKQATTTTQTPYEMRIGATATDGQLCFGRANTSFHQVKSSVIGNLLGVGKNQMFGYRSPNGIVTTTGDFFSSGRISTATAIGGPGTGACTDSGTSPVWIARRYDGATQLDGRIYWIALWNRVLRDSEWLALWRNPWLIYDMVQSPVGPAGDAASGSTGTLAYTNANDTLAGAGTQTNTGTLARTNANDTSAGSGTQTNTGTLARANANDTLAGAGAQTNSGALAYSNANDTLAAVGYLATTGTADVTNANDTLAATGSGGDLIDSFYDRPSKRKEKFNQKREERDERLQDILQMFEAKMEPPKIAPIVVQPRKVAPAFDYERDDEETLMALL